ncbi:MAG: glycosyltransferase, partial [Deltaproteobacteria bacterium]
MTCVNDPARPVKVALVSSILPNQTTGGEIVLHRHLSDQKTIDLHVFDGSPENRKLNAFGGVLFSRLQRTRFSKWVEDYWAMAAGVWVDRYLHRNNSAGFDIVLTVAHGDAFLSAIRFAERNNLPLVSIFHDWWPDIAGVHPFMRGLLGKQFYALAKKSQLIFSVSQGMNKALGFPQKSRVLPPIPSIRPKVPLTGMGLRDPGEPFRVLYFGNLFDYAPMLQQAIEASWQNESIRLE